MVDVGTARLRESTAAAHGEQALAAADAGTSWVRALLTNDRGDLTNVLADLATAHSTMTLSIDSRTQAKIAVSLELPGGAAHADHVDVNLQENPTVGEAPVQVESTATVSVDGNIVATRTVSSLLRRFSLAPYSEVVGVIDDVGLSSQASPGDPAGQPGGTYATELRMHAYAEVGTAPPVPADLFKSDAWSDGNVGSPGILP